mgnify:CR=1 FL=1
MHQINFTAVIWREEAGYVSKCPELGVASAGDTPDEAKRNLQEAISLYLDNAEALGFMEDLKEVLESDERYTTTVEVMAK